MESSILDLKTLEHIKFMFSIFSDNSTQTLGYASLCRIIEKVKENIIIKTDLNNFILVKSLELIGDDNCADLSCNKYVFNSFIIKLKSYSVKEGLSFLDYNKYTFGKYKLKLWINIVSSLGDNEIMIGNDIGVNEHIIKIIN